VRARYGKPLWAVEWKTSDIGTPLLVVVDRYSGNGLHCSILMYPPSTKGRVEFTVQSLVAHLAFGAHADVCFLQLLLAGVVARVLTV